MRFFLFFAFLLCFLTNARVIRKYLVVHTMQAAPDSFSRQVITANGEFPMRPIIANKGDVLLITVENRLNKAFSLHCHGLFFRGAPWYDGFPGVTQCPIPPGESFTYTVDLTDQVGTTWIHSHYDGQYVDGFAAPLIILEETYEEQQIRYGYHKKKPYDDEYIVFMRDWYHQNAPALTEYYLRPGGDGNEPIPDSGIINGKGRCGRLKPEDTCNPNAPLTVYNFQKGKKYRLRLINASAFSSFQFSIDQHRLQIIEADMTPVKPYTVDKLTINVAQRYSVIVEANQPASNYWLKADISTACFPDSTGDVLNPTVLAQIHYQGATKWTNKSFNASIPSTEGCVDLNPKLLKPVKSKPPYPMSNFLNNTVMVVISFGPDDKNVNRAFINGISNTVPYGDPILVHALKGDNKYLKANNVIDLPKSDVVQFFIANTDNGEHPFHMHGHEFQVLYESDEQVDWKTGDELQKQVQEKFDIAMKGIISDNPLRRDTLSVPASGYALIRIVANNPGVWALHCHIDWHVQAGLTLLFNERPQDQRRLKIPSSIAQICRAFNSDD